MTNGIELEWEEPGPADKVRLTVVHGSQHTVAYRDPTESDLTRALELLATEVRGRVIAKWRMRVDSQECGEEIRDLKNRLALSERQVTASVAAIPTTGWTLGADGLAYPKALSDANAAHWKAVAEKAERERDAAIAKLEAVRKAAG